MDLTTGSGPELDETGLDSLQLGEDIRHLIAAPSENASSFTALLELPANQAVELLHSDSGRKQYPNLTFPSNTALLERTAIFSVFHSSNSTDSSSVPSNSSSKNLEKGSAVKCEQLETESYLDSCQPLVSDPTVDNSAPNARPSSKRKEREKKVKAASKKSKSESSQQEEEKLPYVHVRARRGQATDSHSLAERARREKINQRMKLLQELVPGCNKDYLKSGFWIMFWYCDLVEWMSVEIIKGRFKFFSKIDLKVQENDRNALMGLDQKFRVWKLAGARLLFKLQLFLAIESYLSMQISGTALVLDEIINHVQSLQRHVELLSMRLAAVNPGMDFNVDSLLAAESGSLIDSNFPNMAMPLMWPEAQVNGNRHQFQQHWQFDSLQQPVWGREEDSHNFITPENS
ncbi:hypothetical protein DKX38_009145 [Salix brachista]|uniref:BHLH domain-containing protein n=1 Tax=Salix brachista TaxID=2182728 RepID=A0A5N5M9N1_9ROSI|nr:hypothetical protein DKX38_009145 [Salix brachista]